jgi:hypothetical protein
VPIREGQIGALVMTVGRHVKPLTIMRVASTHEPAPPIAGCRISPQKQRGQGFPYKNNRCQYANHYYNS